MQMNLATADLNFDIRLIAHGQTPLLRASAGTVLLWLRGGGDRERLTALKAYPLDRATSPTRVALLSARLCAARGGTIFPRTRGPMVRDGFAAIGAGWGRLIRHRRSPPVVSRPGAFQRRPVIHLNRIIPPMTIQRNRMGICSLILRLPLN
jgi:hypothetical protein